MLKLIVPDRGGVRNGEPFVSISGKLKRILIFQGTYTLMKLKHGDDFDHVQFWTDTDQPHRFWIKPVADGEKGSVRIAINSANSTRTISAAYLLKALDWKEKQSVRCPLEWDSRNNAAMVVIKKEEKY
jgi:hypothetical protein